MRGQRNAAIQGVVVHRVAGDHVFRVHPGLIAEQYTAGVQVHFVVRYRHPERAYQVDSLAAVVAFAGFKRGLPGARAGGIVEALVVVGDMVTRNQTVGGVGDQNALVIGISDGEAGYQHIGQPAVIQSVDIHAVGQPARVDDGGSRPRADQRQRFAHHHVLGILARADIDLVSGGRGRDGGADGGVASGCARRIHAQCFGRCEMAHPQAGQTAQYDRVSDTLCPGHCK